MSDALNIAQVRILRLCRAGIQWCGLALLLSTTAVWAQERRVGFDMPAQSLASALVGFADRTGMAALIDGELTNGLQSSPVKGYLSPPDALRILLAGTGLSIRYAGVGAFTVGLTPPEQSRQTTGSRLERHTDYGTYFSQVQSAIERALCRDEGVRPGQYRTAFQMWIGDNGTIRALHFLGSTGNESRDAAITTVLTQVNLALPPRDLPQPLTIVLLPKAQDPGCTGLTP